MRGARRGIVLVTTLLAVVLIMALLAVMVDIDTAGLRATVEESRSAQALAAADAGAQWVRALLQQHDGDLSAVLTDLAKAHSTTTLAIDADTSAQVLVGLQAPGASRSPDHIDLNVEANPQIAEAPLQVVSTAIITTGGTVVASRTVTTLLRCFHHVPPYSEVVGVIDDGGPSSIFSPGDPAGQVGSTYATDLRIHVSTEVGSASPVPASTFKDDSWSDGNPGAPGLLP